MIVYTIEIQISKFANIKFCDLDQSEPGRQIKFRVCFFILYGISFRHTGLNYHCNTYDISYILFLF